MNSARAARLLAFLPRHLLGFIVRHTRHQGFVHLTLYLAGVDVGRVEHGNRNEF